MKKIFSIVLAVFFLSLFPLPVRAEYMLPYPSYMPGNKLYAVSKVFETVSSLWSWGSIGQVKYHMWLADKYLVEAKTLFEYTQYVLALKALHVSDSHILLIPKYLQLGVTEGKRMDNLEALFLLEREAHMRVLFKLQQELPKTFIWTPEKEAASVLNLETEISHSMTLRLPR